MVMVTVMNVSVGVVVVVMLRVNASHSSAGCGDDAYTSHAFRVMSIFVFLIVMWQKILRHSQYGEGNFVVNYCDSSVW